MMTSAARRRTPSRLTRSEAWRRRKAQFLAEAAAGARLQEGRSGYRSRATARGGRPYAARRAPARRRRYEGVSSAALPWPVVRLAWPALPRLRLGWRFISILMVVLLTAALANLLSAPEFFVDSINLAGARFVPGEEIYRAAQIDLLHILWVDPEQVARKIQALPGIASARVETAWPNVVNISVVERKPVLLWQQGEQVAWVDVDGYVFPARAEIAGLLPILVDDAEASGETVASVPPEAVQGALLLKALRSNIELLHYDSQHGLSYQDGRGWRGYFGVGLDMALKLNVYETLVADIWSRGIRPALIDVGNPDAPYYRR